MILDLHIHSKHSTDSPIEVATILKLAKKKGLQGVAITDHNTIGGGIEALRINRDPGFATIVGCEIETTDKVDILGLFLTEEIQSREGNEVLEEIKEQDGVAVWAHPYRGGKNLLPSPLIRRMDVIEGFNAKTLESQNMLARALAERFRKPVIGVSDAHAAAEIGNAAAMIDCSSPDEIKEALLKGQTHILGFKLSNAQLYDLQFPAKQPA
ncbi:MAG TPA: PHP-associated domain-containing protein [Candidatus Bathyarchaeia archaeon]|nr:PHP-associated domain-containing protein [Candidatus Bathyarchaeia archaeon]